MAKSKTARKRTPKQVLKLPDLEQSKSAVLNSLTTRSSQRTYDQRIHRMVLFRTQARLQQDSRHTISNFAKTETLRFNYHQLAFGSSPEAGLRGC
jgi:hypothetical protein